MEYDFSFNPLACNECNGACCIGESGYIWVTRKEIIEISEFLKLPIDDFSLKYIKKVKHRYSLIEVEFEKNSFACIFFDINQKKCNIYDVRPNQCKTFPFWEQFKNNKEEVKKECIGVF